ncbi:MAG: AsmA-like C-terminal region-containing protein [Gemmatimonadota bacterium]|nr:AsmA-like C-terminal region-containing protein [Gemmatimonadota bacterium]
MTLRKKPFVIGGGIFVLVLLLLLSLPVLFKDRIAERVEEAIDRAVDADVSWSGVELTLIRTFPNLTLGLRDLRVVGTDPFTGDTLASLDRARIALDAGSVIRSLRDRGPLVVRSVRLEVPTLRLQVTEDGAASWDIFTDDAEAPAGPADDAPGRAVAVALDELEVLDGSVTFDDARSGLFVSLDGLGHTLSGDFSRERLVASSRTRAERATVEFGGVPYLAGVTVDFDADLDVDLAEGRIALEDNELRLNDLLLRFAGEVARVDDRLALALSFEAPETDFRQMLSLVPALYAADFASLETSGRFSVSGDVEGDYGEDAFPAFALHATVEDGAFRYPDLPERARAISAELSISNPGGHVDSTVVDLSRFHIEVGGQPLDAVATVRTPVSDPDVDATVRGTLDLAALSRTVKAESLEGMEGVVTADATVRARMSDVDSARYDRVAASGTVSARDVTLDSPELRQPVTVEEATLDLASEQATLRSFQARLGSSDLAATARIDNLLGFAMRDEPLRGTGSFSSRRFVLDEWKSDDELEAIAVPAILDLTLDGTVERLTYGALEMSDARGSMRVSDQRLTLDDFTFGTLGGRIGVSGHYETTDPSAPTFGLALALDSLDIAGASEAFVTVRSLAPVARYARGTFSADLDLSGVLTQDMAPVLDALDGAGSLLTSRIEIEDFPLLERLSQALRVSELAHPTFNAVRSTVEIRDGRLHVQPFDVSVAGLTMTVDGSNGIDQSLDYRLGLAVPSGMLGAAGQRVVQDLASRAGRAGFNVGEAETVQVGVRVAGTVSDPALDLGLGETAASVRQMAGQAAGAAVDRQVEEAQARIDEAEAEARRRARARADSLVAEAEERAETIRAEARRLADRVRAEGERRAEEVLAQATNPLTRRAAEPVAERIRREAEERASRIEQEADERADRLVAEARERAGGG